MRISRNCELLAGTVVRTLFVKAAEMQSIFRLDVSFTPIPIIWCLVKSCEDGILVTCLEHCENSAAAALDAFSTARPDVLVSDIAMPREDGYSLIRHIRER